MNKPPSPLAVIVLAAGKGTRMKSDLPKVLHTVCGASMLGHILVAVESLAKPSKTLVVTGHGAEQVEAAVLPRFKGIGAQCVRQSEQKGTGHAVMVTEKALAGFEGTVVIVYGDILLNCRGDVLPTLLEAHAKNRKGLTMLTADVDDPTGFGRLFRKGKDWLNVEEKDCTPAQRRITTVNPCIYAIEKANLFKLLKLVKPNNAQKELYLTDIIALAPKHRMPVKAVEVEAVRPEIGVNNRVELAEAELLFQTRLRRQHMANGVTMLDPRSVYLMPDTHIAADVTVGQNVVFGPGVVVESGVEILPFCHLEGCVIKSGARVGPFARVRPGSMIGEGAHLGNFVEVKNSTIGKGSKANHLTYVGDADVGADVNLGAGTITANYNRKTGRKSRTVISDGASTGSQTVLVAPVKLGKGAYTGAGTVVRRDVADHALVVGGSDLKTKKGYGK